MAAASPGFRIAAVRGLYFFQGIESAGFVFFSGRSNVRMDYVKISPARMSHLVVVNLCNLYLEGGTAAETDLSEP
jgi:hypothetical protein